MKKIKLTLLMLFSFNAFACNDDDFNQALMVPRIISIAAIVMMVLRLKSAFDNINAAKANCRKWI